MSDEPSRLIDPHPIVAELEAEYRRVMDYEREDQPVSWSDGWKFGKSRGILMALRLLRGEP